MIVAAVAVVLFVVTGNFGTLLVLLGIGVLGAGVLALITGGLRRFRIRSRKAGAVVVAAGLLVMAVGSGVNAATSGPELDEAGAAAVRLTAPLNPSASPTPAASKTAKPSATPKPVDVVSEAQEIQALPHSFARVEDANYYAGFEGVTVAGALGEKVVTYKVTTRDGVEVSREVVSEVVTVAPVDEITTVGTRVPPPVVEAPAAGGCDSNYTGACVPISSDVDCAGGSGNGPAYVSGPVQIVGSDIYDLDRDGDGIACD